MHKLLVGICTLIFWAGASEAAAAIKILEISTPFTSSVLFVPNDGKPHPGIVVLHGSEGGSLPYHQLEAQFLAAQGYAALAFCWYNCAKDTITGAFDTLENVDLDKTLRAVSWLKNSKYTSGHGLALAGFSRGAEQAMILGSLPGAAGLFDAIAVHTPADKVVMGFTWATMDKRCWICPKLDDACFNHSEDPDRWDWESMRWNVSCGAAPKDPSTLNAWLYQGKPLTTGSAIAIENFAKPVFITVGDQDELWDYKQSVRLKERLEKAGKPVELHVFPGEHHVFSRANENIRHEHLIKFLGAHLH